MFEQSRRIVRSVREIGLINQYSRAARFDVSFVVVRGFDDPAVSGDVELARQRQAGETGSSGHLLRRDVDLALSAGQFERFRIRCAEKLRRISTLLLSITSPRDAHSWGCNRACQRASS